jgi:hypothetical protein
MRPGRIRPLGALGYTLGAPFYLPVLGYAAAEGILEGTIGRLLSTKAERAQHAREKQEEQRREAAITAARLDEVFDGNWNTEAGRLLLTWYAPSSHPERLLMLSRDGIALAAPPRRRTLNRHRDGAAQLLLTIPHDRAVLEDPLPRFKDSRLRLRFRDGSWLVLTADESGDLREHIRAARLVESEAQHGGTLNSE